MNRPTTASPLSGASEREGVRALRESPIRKIFSPVAVLAVRVCGRGAMAPSAAGGKPGARAA
eukprot:2377883-Pyramimonas_sp.AAC.1